MFFCFLILALIQLYIYCGKASGCFHKYFSNWRPSGTLRLDTSFTGGSSTVLQPQVTAVGFLYHSVLVERWVLVMSWAGLGHSFEMWADVRCTAVWLFPTIPASLCRGQTLLPAAEGCLCRVAAWLSCPFPVNTEKVGMQISDNPREGASNK